MQDYKSFTAKCTTIANALQTRCGISEAISIEELNKGKGYPCPIEYDAIWDTGATRSSISQRVVDALGLKTVGYGNNQTAGGLVASTLHMVSIMLPCGVGIPSLLVSCCELDGFDVLIGMDVITKGDFSVTNVGGKTTFSFRIPSLETIDYVTQRPACNMPIVKEKKPGRNDLCPCGSGKKYKNCHGKEI